MLKPEKGIRRKPGKKFWILLITGVLILALAAFFLLRPLLQKEKTEKQSTATVTRGAIQRTIEGSGVIAANDQYTVSSLVTGEVLSDTFEEGDMVNKDDLLYVIDSSDLDYELEKADSNIASTRLTYEDALETQENMIVTAPISGTLQSLSVSEGDEILKSPSVVAEIAVPERMKLTVPFLDADAQNIKQGDKASILPENSPSETLSGTVHSVSTGRHANSSGVSVATIEILVDNPGGITTDSRAAAMVGEYACNDLGTFSYEQSASVIAKNNGIVTGLSCKTGDRVIAGQTLFTLKSGSTERSIEKSRISYNDAVSSYNNTYDQLEDYKIKAPISGKVIQKTVKAGDKLESGSGSNASSMAIIADLSILTFEMSVDELDITNIEEGQEVQITADAVDGRMFSGKVDNVSIVGTTSNGVTSYPVKVVLDGEENAALIPGMNVNATIIIEQKKDVLLIPTSAISRGNMVAVKGDAPRSSSEPADTENSAETKSDAQRINDKAASRTANMEAPDGFYYVRIETGITDGTYIEVISGLSEGDEILLPASAGDASTAMQFTPDAQNAMMGGMGGMGGGMPGGGMPGGSGMPGGMRR